jgi:hypothetical protein
MEAQIPAVWTSLLDMAGTWVAVLLTLFVFSYLLGDNVLYRLAEHIFVGVAVGYATVVVFHSILAPKLLLPLVEALRDGDWNTLWPLLLPLILGILLLTRAFKTTGPVSWLGSLSVALLLGVGAALAIQGGLFGTLVPLVDATTDIMRYARGYRSWTIGGGQGLGLVVFSGVIVLIGTIGVLLHFSFGASREGRLGALRRWLVRTWGGLGRWFIFIAFGAILATTFVSRLSLLVGRIQFLLDAARGLLGGWG